MKQSLCLGAWWPEGRSSSSVFQSLPSCSWSACQMAVNRKDGYRGELSLWGFLQLCFYSVWGRCAAERVEQTLRCAQLGARLSVGLCSPGLWHYYTTLRWYNRRPPQWSRCPPGRSRDPWPRLGPRGNGDTRGRESTFGFRDRGREFKRPW